MIDFRVKVSKVVVSSLYYIIVRWCWILGFKVECEVIGGFYNMLSKSG